MTLDDTGFAVTRGFSNSAALAALLGGFLTAASPAAACSDALPPQTFFRPVGTYVCHVDCEIRGSGAREIRRITFTDRAEVFRSIATCVDICNSTPGCDGYTYWDWWEGDAQRTQCIFYSLSGTETSADRATEGASNWVACRRQPLGGHWRDPRRRIDADRFQMDRLRPNVPAPSMPKKP